MDLGELAELKRNHKFDKIVEYGEGIGLEHMQDTDAMIFVGEAFRKLGRFSESTAWFRKALELSWDETAAINLADIYKNINDASGLQELKELLGQEGIYEEITALAHYEYLRCRNSSLDELIQALKNYVSLVYDERYLLLLAELYIRKGETGIARSSLKDMQRVLPTGICMLQVKALLEALDNGTAEKYIENNSISNEIYEKVETTEAIVVRPQEEAATVTSKARSTKAFISLTKAFDRMKKATKKILNEEPISVEERFEAIIGMTEARNELANLYRLLCLQNDRKRNNFNSNLITTTHFAISGKEGSGKTTLASIIAKLLYDFGLREVEEAVLIEAKDLETNMEDLNRLSGTVLIIENIEKCADRNGSYDSIAWPLRRLMHQHADVLSVIITGSEEGIQELCAQVGEIKELLYASLKISEYSLNECMEIAARIVHSKGFELSKEAAASLRKKLDKERRQPFFADGNAIEKKLDHAIRQMADRYAQLDDTTDEDMATLLEEDFNFGSEREESLSELLNQLDSMTGLTTVKDEVQQRINAIIAQKQAEKAGAARKSSFGTLHMVFQGGPGTGKTTVARIIGKIYQRLEVLPSGDIFVECTRKNLVGQYLGHTAKQVEAKVKEAMGGVLFIDEAYSLCTGENDTFGKEAVDTLIAEMENYRDSLMVIFAGYTSDMNKFLNANEGLRSRIARYITFQDYSVPEMVSIFGGMVKSKNMHLDADTRDVLTQLIEKKSKLRDFGNARGVRNLLDKTIEALNERVIARLESEQVIGRNEYDIITSEDLNSVLNGKSLNEKSLQELMEELNQLTGLTSVKEEIKQKVNKIIVSQKAKSFGVNRQEGFGTLHMIFKGNPGTGKTTVARLVGSIYRQLGILPEGDKVIECSRSDLVGEYMGKTAQLVKSKIEEAMGGVLFIDEAYTLSRDDRDQFGREAIDALVADLENYRDSFMVILAGYTKEMDNFLTKNPGLTSRISSHITFEDYTASEMVSILKGMIKSSGFILKGVEDNLLEEIIREKSRVKDFGNARGVRNILQVVTAAMDNRLQQRLEDMSLLGREDFITIIPEDIRACVSEPVKDKESLESLLTQLNGLTGLTSVKEKVTQMVHMITARKLMAEKGLSIGDGFGTLHLVFKGNAGTGKTTVARLIGKIYHRLGVLSQGELFIECSRQDLVAGYLGQTAIKVKEKVNQALGGILFIDEAYSLKQSDNDSFGQEAIDTLVAEVENHREELMVIIAGYSREMDRFLSSNQGLESRFANEIIFEDYNTEELISIFKYQAEKLPMIITKELEPIIRYRITQEIDASKNFGNARGIRNLVEKANNRRMVRIAESAARGIRMTADEMMTMTEDDL